MACDPIFSFYRSLRRCSLTLPSLPSASIDPSMSCHVSVTFPALGSLRLSSHPPMDVVLIYTNRISLRSRFAQRRVGREGWETPDFSGVILCSLSCPPSPQRFASDSTGRGLRQGSEGGLARCRPACRPSAQRPDCYGGLFFVR